jgi:hypothetical protein
MMLNRFSNMLNRMSLSLCAAPFFFALSTPMVAQSTTFYVATNGNDSNQGTSTSPWRNPQKCARSPIKAGDTCIVRSGTYTTPASASVQNVIVYVGGSSPAGTSSQPITIKSEKPSGAVIKLPSTSQSLNAAFYIAQPYYIIEGFDITGGTNSGSSVGYVGITFQSTATGGVARLNTIHHIARTVCSNSGYGMNGISMSGTSNLLIERNRIYSIGRLRTGESGCSTNKYQHDHGIYSKVASHVTIRRNAFYDVTRGFPLHFFKSSGGTHSNIFVHHNTIAGKSPTGRPAGQIIMCNTLQNVQIRNNILIDLPDNYAVMYCPGTIASSVSISHNITNGTRSDFQNSTSKPSSGITYVNNITNANPAFISASTHDYRLTSSSPAINRGTTSGVPAVSDGRPDMGTYEYAEQNNLVSPLTPTGAKAQ